MGSDSAMHDDLPPPGVSVPAMVVISIGVLVLLAATIGIMLLVFQWQIPNEEPAPPRQFPSPRVVQDEAAELHQLRAQHRQQLQTYRWVDRKNGVIAIPIETAMQRIVKRGKDAYSPVGTAPATSPQADAQPRNAQASSPAASAQAADPQASSADTEHRP
jgi:hypothetical protein